ncbi:glycosyltransferase family 9 protein [Pontiella agarivorans]|uniref:Glycosyltransferase family 9 protein n=1 Tax=Pontiella agarivorans TaxID=3038953 RepID=A0ABU5N0P2_9BACT|nr:glycosyltransferase family 9 protein [Pontiella agarivorans]MDZ8119989.1 glycosyltransferase family 9 protein [Pontiella agarivorans]
MKKERILIIRLKSIGDVLHTLPAVNAVRQNYPDAQISFLVCKSIAPLISGFSAVDEIISIDRNALKHPGKTLPTLFSLLNRIRPGRFSHVIDLQGYGETAWITWFTGAPQRWGSVYRSMRKLAYTRGLDRDISSMHVIDWYLSMLRQCGLQINEPDNTFHLPENYTEQAAGLFREHGLDPEKPTLMIQPFTSRASKNWPLLKYLSVARFFKAHGIQVFFCGSAEDEIDLEPVRARGHTVITGKSLLVTAGLIKSSSLVLGGDTGILHFGLALDTRILMLFNRKTSEKISTIPYRHLDWVIDPAGFDSFPKISVNRVVEECRKTFPHVPSPKAIKTEPGTQPDRPN